VPPPPTGKDCILVNKVYDQCFTEELVTSQVPVASLCPGITIPPGSSVGCIPVPGSQTCTFAGTVAVTPPLTPFFEEVLVLNSFDISAPIFVAGVTVCAPTLTLTGAAHADLFPLTGVGFTDTLPAGLVVATPNGFTGSCGGAVAAVPGSDSISLSGGTLAAGASCTFSVNATGTSGGIKDNITSAVTSNEGGTGNTASTSLTVSTVAPPAISKAFRAASIPVGKPGTTLTFTITNPNTSLTLTGVAFTDPLPVPLLIFLELMVGLEPATCALRAQNSLYYRVYEPILC
jgi:uncharacterized repeat protein (TIGR01451 family)